MAGIGFQLNKILAREGYTSLMQAYGFAALIGSGPWLIAVISLGMLGTIMATGFKSADVQLFFVSISLIYALTLILTGPIQMILTRHAADQEFANRMENIFPTFVFSLAWSVLLFTVIGSVIFLGFVPAPPLFRMSAAALTALVAATWICGIFLTAIKNYYSVLIAFAIGGFTSFLAAWGLGKSFGATGAMFGFTLGQAVLLLLLCQSIFRQLGNVAVGTSQCLVYFRKYWDLALGGLFYNLGIWIDKFLYWWFDPGAEPVAGILHASPIFDRVVYFSFLTIVPGMAVFLLKLETEFAAKNEQFFQLVLRKGTLEQIQTAKREMIEALREGFILLVKVQGLFTGLLIIGAGRILNILNLGAVQSGVFQISLVGVFLLVIFLALQTILYYLDKRRDAMWCCILLTGLNGAITAVSILAGERWYGFGFLVAAGAAVFWATVRVNYHLQNLDYDTFTSQPIYG